MSCIEAPEDPYPVEHKKRSETMFGMDIEMYSTRILQTADPKKQVFIILIIHLYTF